MMQTPDRLSATFQALAEAGIVFALRADGVKVPAEGGKTTLTVKSRAVGRVAIAPQMLAGMNAGWNQSIDKLGELVVRS